MKFDCGETHDEKAARLSEWHDFYTLLPRKVNDHDCRIFEIIERRALYFGKIYRRFFDWEYRAKCKDS